ncbi:MAG: uncharacterized protein H6R18_622 [Proteobacteria bacterium]|nr:uncharacterized protein [Pseudomonadota bacterium]
MRLEEITVKLRRRTAWEALDLGHALLRAWAGPAYRAWFATYWVAGLLLIALFRLLDWPPGAMLVLWWLKPVFDRVLLFTYSRALFGQPVTVMEVWRALPGILRQPGILSGLTIRRFSPSRAFLLPVWQLEAQKGAEARGRFRVLGRRASGSAAWLIFVCANLVMILWISLILLVEFMMPQGSEGLFSWNDFFGGTEMPLWQEVLINLLSMAAETLVEPFYVASGFSLYLNRRSELEGWDIDLAFRRLAARLSEAGGAAVRGGLLALLLCAGLLATPEPVWAQAENVAITVPETTALSRPKQVIKEILADPVFGKEAEEKQWKAKKDKAEKKEKEPSRLDPYFEMLARLIESLVGGLRVVAWIVAGIVVAFLVYLVIRYRDYWLPGGREKPLPPEFLFGLDVRPESLPDDVVAAARAALAAERVEEALSLLYRGALVVLIHRVQVEFRAGDTENDCLHRVHGRLEKLAEDYFGRLLENWRSVAYARRVPPMPDLESLCSGWEQHFGSRARVA